jgi:hypothetical protein
MRALLISIVASDAGEINESPVPNPTWKMGRSPSETTRAPAHPESSKAPVESGSGGVRAGAGSGDGRETFGAGSGARAGAGAGD